LDRSVFTPAGISSLAVIVFSLIITFTKEEMFQEYLRPAGYFIF